MNTKVSFLSRSKLLLLGTALFAVSLFFGGQANAAVCTWTAASSSLVSNMSNWSGCTTLTGNVLSFAGGTTSTNATFDVSTTTVVILIDSAYVGTINVSSTITVTTTGDFNQLGGNVTLSGSGILAVGGAFGLSTSTGSFNMSGGTLNVTGDTTVTSTFTLTGGSVNLSGSLIVPAAGTFSGSGGTVTMSGTSKNLGGGGTLTFFDLVTSGTITLTGSNITCSDVLTVSGTLNAAGFSITLSGTGTVLDTKGNTGTFTANNTNVVFYGDTANIASTTYYNLTVNNGTAGTLTGSTTVSNVLTVNASKTLALGGSQLTLSGTGTPLSLNGTATFNANTSTVVYSGATNNVASTTYYNLTINSSGTSTIVGSTDATNNLTINSGGKLDLASNLVTFTGNIINSGTLTSSGVSLLGLSGNSKTFGGTGTSTLYDINVGNSRTLTGNISLSHVLTITNGSTLNAAGYTITLSGTGTVLDTIGGTGTFTANTSTVVYSGDSANIASTTYYNLTVNDATAGTLTGSTTVSNVLTVSSGKTLALGSNRLTLSGTGTPLVRTGATLSSTAPTVIFSGAGTTHIATATTYYDLVVNSTAAVLDGDVSIHSLTIGSAGALDAAGATITIAGTGDVFLRNGTFTASTSTVSYTAITSANIASTTYYNLNLNTTSTLTGSTTVSNLLTVGATNIVSLGGSQLTLSGTGTPLSLPNTATFNANTSTVVYSGATSNIASTTYYNLTVNDATAGTLTGSTTVSNVLTVSSGKTLALGSNRLTLSGTGTPLVRTGATLSSTAPTVIFSGAGTTHIATATTYYDLVVNSTAAVLDGDVSIHSLTIGSAGALDAAGATITIAGTGDVFLRNGTFTASTSTVSYTAITSANIASTTYYNLNLNTTSTLTGSTTVSNLLTVGATNIVSLGGSQLTLSGTGTPLSLPNTATFNANTSTVVYSGATSNIVSTTYYNLTVNSTSTLTGSTTVGSVLTINSSKALNAGSAQVTLTATGTPFVNNGTFTAATSTFIYSSANATTPGNETFYNLTSNSSLSLGTGDTVSNDLVINSGKFVYNAYNLTVGHNITNSGTYSQTFSTLTMSGNGTLGGVGTYDLVNLTFSSTTILSSNISVSGILTVSGILNAMTSTITLTGTGGTPLAISGSATFNANTSTVVYSGASANIASTTYYNLTVNDGTAGTLTGSTTVSNTLSVPSGKTLSAGGSRLTLAGSGTPFALVGNFNYNTSTVVYSNTGSVTTTGASYYTLTLGSGTYTQGASSTCYNAFTNGGTFNVGNYNLNVPDATYTNSGTVTVNGTGVIKKPSSGGMDAGSYTSGSGNGTGNPIVITGTDRTADLNASSADTHNVTLSASTYSDSETVALTETGANTGIFTGTIYFNVAPASLANSKLDVTGNGTVSLTYTNGYGDLTGSATFSGANFAAGGGAGGGSGSGGGSSSPSVSSPAASAISTDPKATSQTVVLTFSVTNASQLALSEDPSFAGASWEAYAPTKSFTLSKGAGLKTVYVKFRSASGGVTSAYKTTVTLDSNYVPAVEAPKPATPPTTPSESILSASVPTFSLSNPNSKLVILPVKKLQYVPKSSVAYTYTFKNETNNILKVKVLRQVVDAYGKVLAKVTGSASIAKGKVFKSNANSTLGSNLADGNYTVQVKVMDAKNNVLAENSFDVMVKKPAPVVKKPVVKPAPVVKKPVVKAPAKKAAKATVKKKK